MQAVITNLRTYGTSAGGLFPDNQQASGSQPGEANEKHVVIAIAAVAALVIFAGVVNARISIGRGGGG